MHSLKQKILVLTLVPLSLVLISISALAIQNKIVNERELVLERLNSYRALLESGDLTFETSADKTKLKSLIGETIEFSEILNHDYVVLYSSENTPVPIVTNEEKKDVDEAFQGFETTKTEHVNSIGKTLFVVISPLIVKGRVVAVLHQGLSNEDSSSRVMNYALFIALLTLVGIVVCFLLVSVLLNQTILKNLLMLKKATLEIQKGNLNAKSDVQSHDEIGELSTTFNQMVHDLRHSYAHLNEEKSRLLASINSLSFGFLIVSMDRKVTLKNRAVMDLFKLDDKEEVTLKQLSTMLGGYNLEDEIDRCLKGRGVCELKEIVFDKKILRGLVAPIIVAGDKEKTIGYVLLLEDITEAKVMQRSRDEFFAVASHELRTPLTAIRGNAEMILESFAADIKNGDMKEMLVDIEGASVRLIGIVNDFLEVSSFEQGKVQIKNAPTDVRSIVDKVIRDMSGIVAKKNVTLTYIKPEFPVTQVMADKARIEQVIVNLIGNSLKFTSAGSITISLTKEDKFLRVRVSDTGLGISEKYQSRLFRKFQQAGEDMIARDVTQGTGLGLYICQLIVNAMGGTIGLEKSELGKGSTFSFTLPVV